MANLNNKPVLAAVLTALIITGMVFFVVAPLVMDIKETGVEIGRQKTIIENYDKRISRARGYISFSKEHEANLKKLDNFFVDEKMPLDFINALEAAAREAKVKIKFSSTMPQQENKESFSSITIGVQIGGNAAEILRFIEKMENIPYLVSIQSVNIQTKGSQPWASNSGSGEILEDAAITANILLEAYAKKSTE